MHILLLQTDANTAERCAFGQTIIQQMKTILVPWT